MFSKKKLLKTILQCGGSICASFTIDKIIKDNVFIDNIPSRLMVNIGSLLIGCVISEKIEDYILKEFNQIDQSIKEAKNKLNEENANG